MGNIYYWPGRRNNFFRLRSVRCFLHVAMPVAVFDGIRPLFRLKITGELMKFWISKSSEGWQRKVHRKYEKEDWFLPENWRSMRKNLDHQKKHQITQRNATRHFDVIVQLYIMDMKRDDGTSYELPSNRIRKHDWEVVEGTCFKWNAHCEM